MGESMGIEKVVVELNGFRQRTSMLKEEIGRVSRALAERAGQLNDIVGKSLRDLREQLGGTTLSGFMSLQWKNMQGEMNDKDYNSQRDYSKNELQGMIIRIDVKKKIMMLTAQIQTGASRPVDHSS